MQPHIVKLERTFGALQNLRKLKSSKKKLQITIKLEEVMKKSLKTYFRFMNL